MNITREGFEEANCVELIVHNIHRWVLMTVIYLHVLFAFS
jgi:hypothetical protein